MDVQPSALRNLTIDVIEAGALLLVLGIIGLLLWLGYMYVVDVTQKKHAIRRNYPIIGRFRYLFEHLGAFFRQYFFAMDREELPFNRAQRTWIYRAAKNLDSTVAFGSTQPMNQPGQVIFLNSLLPPLESEISQDGWITFGESFAANPFRTRSFFNISAMSFGALSAPAVTALSHGASQAGIWLNTGEGGLSPYHLQGGCDIIFQIGTAKYGVRDENGGLSEEKLAEIAAIEQVRMFEIKLSQGAKPGKGGILPGIKVTEVIASTRGIPAGVDSISPNRHPEIHSIDDLLDMIHRVRSISGKPTGIKAVIGQPAWLDEFCQRIHERGMEYAPDFFTVDSGDGGSGAAPQSLIDNMGLPVRRSLPLVADKLTYYGLRQRVRVIASGKLINPTDVAMALCLGADCVNTARGFMFSLGCIQAMQCNKNTCPSGVTTHNEDLQKGLDPENKAVRVANFARNMAHEVEVIAHSCGVMHPHELNRGHAAIIDARGLPEPLTERYPEVVTAPEFRDWEEAQD